MAKSSIIISWGKALSDGVNLHRIENPSKHINNSYLLPIGFQEIPNLTTHIVFNSVYTYSAGKQQEMLDFCKSQGVKVILDLDDYWRFPKTHSKYNEHKKNNYSNEVEFCIKNADIVWCASKELLKISKKINSNSHYIPNAVDSTFSEKPRKNSNRVGYVGSAVNHLEDIKLLAIGLKKLSAIQLPLPHSLTVGWCGWQNYCDKSQEARKIIELAGQHFVAEYLPPNLYTWHYRHLDVAIAPLQKKIFNNYKSNLKAIEAGAMGCVFICSDSIVYEEFSHNVNCIKVKKDEWDQAILSVAKNPDKTYKLASALQSYVLENYNAEKVAKMRIATL